MRTNKQKLEKNFRPISLPSNDRRVLILLESAPLQHIFTGFYRQSDNQWLILTMEDDQITGGTGIGYKIVPRYYKIIKWKELPLEFENLYQKNKGIIIQHQNL